MYNSTKKYFSAILVLIGLPFFAFGAGQSGMFNPLPVATQLYCPTKYCDLLSMLLLILKDFLAIIPVMAVLVIIIGGFQLITSSGNEQRIIKGKKTILWAVLGLVLAFLSFSIIAIVQNLLSVG